MEGMQFHGHVSGTLTVSNTSIICIAQIEYDIPLTFHANQLI